MYSFSNYPWKFRNICEKLSIFPWLKTIFRKLLRCRCFAWNFPQYLKGALSLESYTSRWLHSYSFRYCTDFFLCSGEQNYYSSLLYNGMQKLSKIDHPTYSSNRKLCYSPLFLKNEILEKIRTKTCETEQRRGCCQIVRNAVKLSDTRWNCDSWDIEIHLIHLGNNFFKKVQLDTIRFLESSLRFLRFLFLLTLPKYYLLYHNSFSLLSYCIFTIIITIILITRTGGTIVRFF